MSLIPYEVSIDDTEAGGSGGGGGGSSSVTVRSTDDVIRGSSGHNTSNSSGTTTTRDGSSGTPQTDPTTPADGSATSSSRSSATLCFTNVPSGGTVTMVSGESMELQIQVQSETQPQTVFESSNTSVAIVSKTYITRAKLTAKSVGTTTIKVYFTSSSGNYFEDSFKLVVKSSSNDIPIPEDKKIWLTLGQKREITITEKASLTSVESSNSDIASFTKTAVDKAVVTAKSLGICTIKLVVKEINGNTYTSDAYYVIVTHGDGTNYLDVVSFEKSTTWENLNLGSVFVIGCSRDETVGYQGVMFESNVLSPESWRNLVDRSYKEVKICRLGQDISINVTSDGYMEDLESEESWTSQWTIEPDSETGEVPDIFCKFLGLGVYKFNVQSNCPVRFKTTSDRISIGPWSGTPRYEYVISDFGNSKVLPIHILSLPENSVEIIEISYESPDSRISKTLKVALYPPLPGLIDIRGPYIFVIPSDSGSYNQKIEVKSYGNLRYSGIEYPKELTTGYLDEERLRNMWTSNLAEADEGIRDSLRINISNEPYPSPRTDNPGVLKYYITLKSVTGYKAAKQSTPPVARIRFDVSNSSGASFEPTKEIPPVRKYVYYYIYVLPEIPIKNADTYEPLEDCPKNSYVPISVGHSIFERLRTEDLTATWPGGVRFVDPSGIYENFAIRYPEHYASYGTRNNFGVTFEVMWTGSSYTWEQAAYGEEVGSLVIKWYYNKDYIIQNQGLYNYYYINNGDPGYTGTIELPYSPNNQFYTQTVHIVKFQRKGHILNEDELPTHYSAIGTYDPFTLNPSYKVIKTDLPINQTVLVSGGYWKYVFREEEVDNVPIRYTCKQNTEHPQFLNLTIEPRGNNVSFALDEWEELIPYYSVARGEVKFVCESNVNHKKSDTVLDTFSFTQDGLEDCILVDNRFYLGRSEINLPDISFTSFDLKIGGKGIKSYKISDIAGRHGQLDLVSAIPGGINIIVWKEGQSEPVFNETRDSFTDIITLPENNTGSEITYTIEVVHTESVSNGGEFESRIIIKVKQRTKSSDVYIPDGSLPDIYSYGALSSGLVLYTSIPKNKIMIEEVTRKDSNDKWIVGSGIVGKPRIISFTEENPDPNAPLGYKCYKCFFSFTPNSSFVTSESSSSYLGEDITRTIRIRHVDIDEGNTYDLKQGYYTIYPTLMYKTGEEDQDLTIVTEKDSRNPDHPSHIISYNMEEKFWQVGTQYSPVDLPPFQNAGSNRDMNKVWVSLMALRHEVGDGNIVTWEDTARLFNLGALEIESNSRKLFSDTVNNSDIELSEGDWFRNIQTDLVIHSTDITSENTWRVLKDIEGEGSEREDIEFPALETIYTASGAGFYERRVIIQEDVELKLGVLTKEKDIFYEGSKPYTVNSKIRIWYRKIGEDIKDE